MAPVAPATNTRIASMYAAYWAIARRREHMGGRTQTTGTGIRARRPAHRHGSGETEIWGKSRVAPPTQLCYYY